MCVFTFRTFMHENLHLYKHIHVIYVNYICACERAFLCDIYIYIYMYALYLYFCIYVCVCSIYIYIFIYLERFTCVSGTLREYVYYVDCLKGRICLLHERLEARNAANSCQIKSRGCYLWPIPSRGQRNTECMRIIVDVLDIATLQNHKTGETFDKIKGGWRSGIYTP